MSDLDTMVDEYNSHLEACQEELARIRKTVINLREAAVALLVEVQQDMTADDLERFLFQSSHETTITPRDAFEGGFDAGVLAADSIMFESDHITATELAWEHYQAERMKEAASTEECK